MDERIKSALAQLRDKTATVGCAVDIVAELKRTYPFFVLPSVMLLKNYADELSPIHLNECKRRIALCSTDHSMLWSVLNPADAAERASFYPEEERKELTTTDAIDEFLATYGEEDPGESALLEKLIFNPVADYSAVLEKEERESENQTSATPDATSERINSFISAHTEAPEKVIAEQKRQTSPQTAPKPSSDSLLSESLAKIYIKQQRFDKAYEIITQLSLNYPEKSCYFADQLRFLRKLIINQRYKNQKTTK